jgi:hypothetical protein
MNCRLVESRDFDLVDSIIKDPELFGRISEDGVDPDTYEVSAGSVYYLIYKGDELAGVWDLHHVNSVTVQIHANILKQHRDCAMEAGWLIVDVFDKSRYQKMIAEIPFMYPDVYHYTKKFGFLDEGVNRLSIMKQGRIISQWRLGLTKPLEFKRQGHE